MSEAAHVIPAEKKGINEVSIVLGFSMIVLFLIGLTLQTATTEAYGQSVHNTTVWDLFISTISQLPGLFTGSVHISELPHVLMGWGIEILYYACITGHNHLKHSARNHHPVAIMALDALAIVIVFFCGYTDFTYAQQIIPNVLGQLVFAVMISSMVAYCGTAGIHFIKVGFGR